MIVILESCENKEWRTELRTQSNIYNVILVVFMVELKKNYFILHNKKSKLKQHIEDGQKNIAKIIKKGVLSMKWIRAPTIYYKILYRKEMNTCKYNLITLIKKQ